jgi:hypothetical protein
MYDGNTRFYPPCTSIFAYCLPFGVRFKYSDIGDIHVIVTDSPVPGVTNEYLNIDGAIDIRGYEMTRISLNGDITLDDENAS